MITTGHFAFLPKSNKLIEMYFNTLDYKAGSHRGCSSWSWDPKNPPG